MKQYKADECPYCDGTGLVDEVDGAGDHYKDVCCFCDASKKKYKEQEARKLAK